MADNSLPYGLKWVGSMPGASGPKPMRVRLASGYAPTVGGTAVNLRAGDPVIQLSTGYWGVAIGSEGTPSLLGGVICGFGPIFDGTVMAPNNKFVSGSGVYSSNFERMTYAWVIPMDGQIFEACADDKTTFTTEATYLAAIGENCDLVLAADTTNASDTKITSLIDISTHAASAKQVRLLDFAPRPNEDYSGLYVKFKITVNNTQTAPTYTTGI